MDITITDLQLKALRRLDPVLNARQVVQIHVDTWLAPIVAELGAGERKAVAEAYVKADATVQGRVRQELGLNAAVTQEPVRG